MKISVIIPCYNGQAFIAGAIGSVMEQSCGDWECLVVDDGSADGSRRIIQELAGQDARIKPLLMDRNRGPGAARNRALDAAQGEWVALLDADDGYRPDRLETLLAFAGETDADIVIDNLVREYPDGRSEEGAFACLKTPQAIGLAEFCRLNLASGKDLPIGYCKPMLRRAFLERHRLRLDPRYRVGEDFLLMAECLLRGARLAATPYCGYVYRAVPSSLSRAPGLAELQGLLDIHDHLLSRCRAAGDRRSARYLAAKRHRLRHYACLREIRDLLKQRRYLAALGVLARRPQIGLLAGPSLKRRFAGMFARTPHV
jgi:glycosyltransferase involved in cell wall biosynthesis